MGWFAFVLISVVGTAIANIFRRVLMKDDHNDPIASAIIFQFIGTIIIGIFAFIHGFVFPPITTYPVNFLIQACFWGTATFMLFKASQTLEASESTIIVTLSSFITILSAIFFLKEGFGLSDIIGTILIISAVVIVSMKSSKLRFSKGVMYAFGFCLFAGFGYTNDAYLVHHTNALSYLTISFLNPGLFLLIIKPSVISKIKPLFAKKTFLKFFTFTFFYAIATMAFIWAISIGGNISQISPISQSAIILTVLFGAIFLKERDNIERKIICAILVTIGVILLR